MTSTALVERGRPPADAAPVRDPTTLPIAPPSGPERVAVSGVDYLSIFTPELRRSVAFYVRVFGFRVVKPSRDRAGRSVLMAAGRTYLAIHERQPSESAPAPALCWSFVVNDLDRARASVWNLGVVPTYDGTYEPEPQRPWHGGRSFVIRDPGGNEIEIVERAR